MGQGIMGVVSDATTIFTREMLIFKSNLRANIMRSVMFPVIIIVFFGSIGATLSNVPVAVVNYANNPQSLSFINALQSHNSVTVSTLTTQQDAMNMLSEGNVAMVIVILPNFPSNSGLTPNIQVYYNNAQLSVAQSTLPVVEQAAANFGGRIQNSDVAYQHPSGTLSTVSAAPTTAAEGSYKDFIASGIIGMVVIFGSIFGSGFSLLTDKQLGNLKSFLITPINKNAIVIGKLMSGALQALLYASLAMIIAVLDGVTIAGGWLAVPVIALAAMIMGVGFSAVAIIIATKVNKVEIYAIVAQATSLPLWFLSGGIEPISSLPNWLIAFADVNPVTYVTDIVRSVMLSGSFSLSILIPDFIIITIFAIAMTLLSFRMLKPTIG